MIPSIPSASKDIIFYNKKGYLFPKPAMVIGYLFIATGVFSIWMNNFYLPFFLIPIGAFTCFTYYGVFINERERTIMQFTRIMGFYFGTWESILQYPFITVTKAIMSYRSNDMIFAQQRTFKKTVYNICLLNQDQTATISIGTTQSLYEATTKMQKWSEDINLQIVTYQEMNEIIKQSIERRKVDISKSKQKIFKARMANPRDY